MARRVRSLIEQLSDIIEGDAETRAALRAHTGGEMDPRTATMLVRNMTDEEARQWLRQHRWHRVADHAMETLQHWTTSDLSPKIRDEFLPQKLLGMRRNGIGSGTVKAPHFKGGESWTFNATLRDIDDPDVKKSTNSIDYVYLLGPHGWIEFYLGLDEQKIDAVFKKIETEVVAWLNKSKFRFAGTWEPAHHWRLASGAKSWTASTPTSIQFSLRWRQPVSAATLLGLISLA